MTRIIVRINPRPWWVPLWLWVRLPRFALRYEDQPVAYAAPISEDTARLDFLEVRTKGVQSYATEDAYGWTVMGEPFCHHDGTLREAIDRVRCKLEMR